MKKSKMITALLICALAILILPACQSKKLQFEPVSILISYKIDPMDQLNPWSSYQTNVDIYNDGRVEMYADNYKAGFEGSVPPYSTKLTTQQITTLQESIVQNNFMNLSENISNSNSLDTTYYQITAHSKKKHHTVGGVSPTNQDFIAVKNVLKEQLGNEILSFQNQVNQNSQD